MAKTTTHKTAKSVEKTNKFNMPKWSVIWSNVVEMFFTGITTVKVLGVGSAAAYLIVTGMNKTDVVYMGLGAVLAGYAIVVFVSTAHIATKSRRAS